MIIPLRVSCETYNRPMGREAEKRQYKIGEVCRMADVQPYVIRYWETEFPALGTGKAGGGQRLYSQRELDIILRIRQLLYSEGFTIAGAKKKLEGEMNDAMEVAPAPLHAVADTPPSPAANRVAVIREEVDAILEMLRR